MIRCHPGSRNNRLPVEWLSMDFYMHPLPQGSIWIRKCHQSVNMGFSKWWRFELWLNCPFDCVFYKKPCRF